MRSIFAVLEPLFKEKMSQIEEMKHHITQMNDNHSSDINMLKESFSAKLQNDIFNLKEKHSSDILELTKKHSADILELTTTKNKEISDINILLARKETNIETIHKEIKKKQSTRYKIFFFFEFVIQYRDSFGILLGQLFQGFASQPHKKKISKTTTIQQWQPTSSSETWSIPYNSSEICSSTFSFQNSKVSNQEHYSAIEENTLLKKKEK